MATDFALFLRRFLTAHLAGLRGCSPNTVTSYRDSFKLLIVFFRDDRSIPPEKLTLDCIDATAIAGFLDWLEVSRHNSVSTRNQRLAAISSFYRWMQSQDPAQMACCQDILAIPAKKQAHPAVNHLSVEQTRRLLAQPDRSTRRGRRDATLLATLYDTAARVQELADLTVGDIRLDTPALAVLTGKANKTRHVPLGDNTAALLNAYLAEYRVNRPGHDDDAVFVNQQGTKLSRGGIAWIIRKYQVMSGDPVLANAELSPHVLRHSKSMHLYDAGVPLPYIRDILGHVDLSTTEIYARASTEAKRRALEAVYVDIVSDDLPEWTKTPDCSTGSPRSEVPHPTCYAQRSAPDPVVTRLAGSTLRITRRCSLGGVVSPVLLNVALQGMEEAAGVRYHGAGTRPGATVAGCPVTVRYADDLVALCVSREQAEEVKTRLAAWLAPRGLAFNEEKTRVVHLDDGFDFLGYAGDLVKGLRAISCG